MMNPYEQSSRQEHSRFTLTPEEERILKECSREATYKRGIPLSLGSALGAYYLTKLGYIKHRTFGAIPAVICGGFMGFFVGRFSSTKTCIQRAMTVPDGTLRKLFEEKSRSIRSGYDDIPDSAYYPPPASKTPLQQVPQSVGTDIDQASVGSFDMTPIAPDVDAYSSKVPEPEELPADIYTKSYDELRQENRKQYVDSLYSRNQARTHDHPPRHPPLRRGPTKTEPEQERTKYGDVWG